MAKRKRTLKEKKKSDMRLQKAITSDNAISQGAYSFSLNTVYQSPKKTPVHAAETLSGLRHDLIKTLSVTGAIVILELALFLLLANHILVLPFGIYK